MSTQAATEITVTVGGTPRRFNLRPFTIGEAIKHIEASELAWNQARESVKESLGDAMQMTVSSRAYLQAVLPTVVSLLCAPADDGGRLTEEEFWSLDAADPARVIAAQEEFAQVRLLAVGGQLLVQEAQREVIADAVKVNQALLAQLGTAEATE